MPAITAPITGDDVSVTSSVALECHSRLILEELSAMVDAEGSDYSSSDDDSDDEDIDDRRRRRQMNGGGGGVVVDPGILNTEVDVAVDGAPGSLSYKHGCADSELSLDDVLQDNSVPLVRRRDARVVDREVRSGSQMFRSRSTCAAGTGTGFNRTGSILGRVIKSASGRALNNRRASSDRVGGAGGADRSHVTGKNATFGFTPRHGHRHHHHHGHHHQAHGNNNGCLESCPEGGEESAGQNLLVDFAPRTNNNARPAAAGGDKVNLFNKDALNSANFLNLLGGGGNGAGSGTGSNPASPVQQAHQPPRSSNFDADMSASSLEKRFNDSLAIEDCPTINE